MPFPLIVCAAVIERDGAVLLTRRRRGDHLEGTWEFPGGKVDPGEAPPRALERELHEELGVEAEATEAMGFSYWEYPEKRVLLLFYHCQILAGEPRPLENDGIRWVSVGELGSVNMPAADAEFVHRLPTLLPPVPFSR